jgi:hypothetical protein
MAIEMRFGIFTMIPMWGVKSPWIRPGHKTLNLDIKCTRFENIYTYSTHNNSSDWSVEANHGFKIKKRQHETQIWSNFVQI